MSESRTSMKSKLTQGLSCRLRQWSLLIIVLLCASCSTPNIIQQQWAYYESDIVGNPDITTLQISQQGWVLHALQSGESNKPAIVLVHGTPGDKRVFSRYLTHPKLLEQFQVIAVDRPGWGDGFDQFPKNEKMGTANYQIHATLLSELVKSIKQQNNQQPVILLGHSLGASITPKVAMEYPELVDGLLLLAGTLSPEFAHPRWYNRLASTWLAQPVLGSRMQKANDEVFSLHEEIEIMAPQWSNVQAKVMVVQGEKDRLVNPKNIDFAEQVIPIQQAIILRLPDDGHLFVFHKIDQVVDWARDLLLEIQS